LWRFPLNSSPPRNKATMSALIQATRIQLICPCGSAQEYIATTNIIILLKTRRRVREWGGFTHSSIDNPGFTGYFWDRGEVTASESERSSRWVPDRNVRIFIDVPEHVVGELLQYLEMLRDKMNEAYKFAGVPQKSLWITLQALHILGDRTN
jgi:hypothetical protein